MIVYSVVSGNTADGGAGCVSGGGIHTEGPLAVLNSTVSGNTHLCGGDGGGGILVCGVSATIASSARAAATGSSAVRAGTRSAYSQAP